jgi:hypothetical protein
MMGEWRMASGEMDEGMAYRLDEIAANRHSPLAIRASSGA